jgi:hypothetical protein
MCLGDVQQTKQVRAKHHTVSLSHPWDKPAQSPWTDWSPPAKKKEKKLNKQQHWKLLHSRGDGGCWKHTREGGKGKELNSSEPSVNKQQEGHRQAGDRPMPEVEKEWRWQTTGLRPWAPTVRRLCSVEEQMVNHHNTQWQPTDRSLTLPCPRERGQGKDTSP